MVREEKRILGIRFRLFRSLTISAIDLLREKRAAKFAFAAREGNVVMSAGLG